MISDKIENYKNYLGLSENLDKAFDYIITTDFSKAENGKHTISGDELFSIVSEYETQELKDVLWEAHRKYIDLQFIIEGTEMIGVSTLDNMSTNIEYNSDKDCIKFTGNGSYITGVKNSFFVFFPQDPHQPGVHFDSKTKVKKVVVKVKI